MLNLKFICANPELVKENIRKRHQFEKLVLVDEILELEGLYRDVQQKSDSLRNQRNIISKQIGALLAKEMQSETENPQQAVTGIVEELDKLRDRETNLFSQLHEKLKLIPNILEDSVPIGKDERENIELERFGEPVEPNFEVPYHIDIMKRFSGIDLPNARKVSGSGFYYLCGDIARLHSALLNYARDYMIDKGFVYCIPPFMIRSNVVNGVMSFAEKQNMMYKLDNEDLYLIGTSEHSMMGRFCNSILDQDQLPLALTSYSPCFRKEVGSHGIEERGIFRVHQFEKQEMVVICEPEESKEWFKKLYRYTVGFFRSLCIPVRTLECCSGDLADLKTKSVDVEAWSPRQRKYFEVGSCSSFGDAQARLLGIRIRYNDKTKKLAHTLNNTVVASPRALIAFLENNHNADGTIKIPEPLRRYMGDNKVLS